MRRTGPLLAVAVIVASNGIALLGVARNRLGTPSQTIQLTERELALNYQQQEDSGVALRMDWARYPMIEGAWLDRTKLEALGIDCATALRDPSHYRQLAQPAFIVLEYDGPAWQEWLKSLEQSKTVVKVQPNSYSRLVVMDAGKSADELLQKYADHQRYLVLRGLVEVHVNDWDPKTQKPGPARLHPSFTIFTNNIHVSPPLSGMLRNLPYQAARTEPRYFVTLTFGSRFEPWVAGIKKP